MKTSSPTLIHFPKLATLLLLCAIFTAPPVHAQAIKMLPPTNCPNIPVGQPNVWGVLGWDSKSPLSCIPNFNFGDNSYVGVGSATTQPLALLDLYGSGTYPYPTPGTGTVGTNLGNIHMQPVDNTDFNSTAITFGGNVTASPSNGNYDGVAEAGIYVQYSHNTAYPEGAAGTKMYFGTTNNYATGAQIRMTIDNLGNVGIGNTSPSFPLVVTDTAVANHTLNVRGDPTAFGYSSSLLGPILQGVSDNEATEEPITLVGSTINLMGGDVGIGMTNPQAPLDVAGGVRGSNSSIVAGNACSPEGMLGYDMTNHQPAFCNGSQWVLIISAGPITSYVVGGGLSYLGPFHYCAYAGGSTVQGIYPTSPPTGPNMSMWEVQGAGGLARINCY